MLARMRSFWAAALALAKREVVLLSILLVAAGGILGFLRVVTELGDDRSAAFDRAVLLALRNPADITDPLGPQWLEQTALQITALGSTTVLTIVTVIVAAWLLLVRQLGAAAFVTIAVVGGAALSNLVKYSFARVRPELVPHIDLVSGNSFPSGHALSSAVVYLTLGTLLTRLRPERGHKIFLLSVATILTLLIGITRVYLGVHWPTDVLAGWCLGATWAMLCWAAALWMQRRR